MIESYHIRLYVCRVSEGYVFRDALEIDIANDVDRRIIGKGSVSVTYTFMPIQTLYATTIDVKPNRIRVTFENMAIVSNTSMTFSYSSIGFENASPLSVKGQLDSFAEEADRLLASLESTSADDW